MLADWNTTSKTAGDATVQEVRTLRALERKASTNQETFHFLQGRLLQAEGKYAESLVELDKALRSSTAQPARLVSRDG